MSQPKRHLKSMTYASYLWFICPVAKQYRKESWSRGVRNLLKIERLRRDISYEQLSILLTKERMPDGTPHNLKNKINRGTYSAIFLIQILKVIGCESLDISDVRGWTNLVAKNKPDAPVKRSRATCHHISTSTQHFNTILWQPDHNVGSNTAEREICGQ